VLSSLLTESTIVTSITTPEASSSSPLAILTFDSKEGERKTFYKSEIERKVESKIDMKTDDLAVDQPITTIDSMTNEVISLTKTIYRRFLPCFDAKIKFIEDIKTSQSLTCDRMLELLTDRFTILKECIHKK